MQPELKLSSNDAQVLTAIFDPEAAPTSNLKIDTTLPPLPYLSSSQYAILEAKEVEVVKPLDVQSPSRDQLNKALGLLTDIIREEPTYAPAYANRAQVRRLLIGENLASPQHAVEFELLLADLESCIHYASPAGPADALSPQQTKLLASVHTHRGYVLMKAASLASESNTQSAIHVLKGRSKDELEEMASKDFFLGGRYGDRTAREMSVRTNPYAKMCGAIVKEALRKEIEGAATVS